MVPTVWLKGVAVGKGVKVAVGCGVMVEVGVTVAVGVAVASASLAPNPEKRTAAKVPPAASKAKTASSAMAKGSGKVTCR